MKLPEYFCEIFILHLSSSKNLLIDIFNSKISYFNIYKNYNTVISRYQYSITEGKETMQLNEVIFKHLILKQHFGLFI